MDGHARFRRALGQQWVLEEARATFLENRPELSDYVVDLGSVSEGQKRWLLERSIAVLYPTLHEGFGLIPFEAASAGTPCIYASQTSLAETLPPTTATIVPWDAAATADRVIRVLVDKTERRVVVEAIRASAARFTWDATAAKLMDVYKRTVISPPKPGRNVLIARRESVSTDRPTIRRHAFG